MASLVTQQENENAPGKSSTDRGGITGGGVGAADSKPSGGSVSGGSVLCISNLMAPGPGHTFTTTVTADARHRTEATALEALAKRHGRATPCPDLEA